MGGLNEVTGLFVTVPARRRGFGLRQFQEVEVAARERDMIKVEFDTRTAVRRLLGV